LNGFIAMKIIEQVEFQSYAAKLDEPLNKTKLVGEMSIFNILIGFVY
jgi:hypothetical protein